MNTQHPEVDAFLSRSDEWRSGLLRLRAILRDMGFAEDFKWNKPCYTFQGRNLAIIAGLRDHFWLQFPNGALLSDPEGLLAPPGENSRATRVIRFVSADDVDAKENAIRALLSDAIDAEKAGHRVDFAKDAELAHPEELTDALDADTGFQEAWAALTSGRQRGWVLHFSDAKQSATRRSRIDKAIPGILAGKGLNDR